MEPTGDGIRLSGGDARLNAPHREMIASDVALVKSQSRQLLPLATTNIHPP